MDSEIDKYLKIALDSSISSYYRKDAVRQLGRIRKSAELSNAVVKLLKDVDDPSLQREAMDLAAQLAVTEAVNLIMPISLGQGPNARTAINVLAKIGGIKAYNSLKEIASAPGFDLSKTAAKRALEDMLRREPQLEKEADESPSLLDKAQEVFEDLKEAVGVSEEKPAAIRVEAQAVHTQPEVKEAVPLPDAVKLGRELKALQSKYRDLEHKLAEKTVKVEDLENKIREMKKGDSSSEINNLKRQLHEGKNESASIKAAFEKQLALLQGQLVSLEEENADLSDRSKLKIIQQENAKKGGCLSFIIVFIIFLLMAWLIIK